MNGFSIYDHYLACTQFRPGEWVAVPDYLEQWNDGLLQEFIMLHDPYLYDYEQLSVERSWRLEMDGKVVYLFCGTTYYGAQIYRMGLQLQDEIAILSPETDEERAKLEELVALVEAQQSAAVCDVSTQVSLAQQQNHSHEEKLEQTTFF